MVIAFTMWRSFIVQTCSSLHERPENDSTKLVERIRRLHKTTTQAGISRDDRQVIIGGKDPFFNVYNVAINAMKLAVEEAEAEQALAREQFGTYIPTN
jgi:hypothetical protein